jgi:hypothetical protein
MNGVTGMTSETLAGTDVPDLITPANSNLISGLSTILWAPNAAYSEPRAALAAVNWARGALEDPAKKQMNAAISFDEAGGKEISLLLQKEAHLLSMLLYKVLVEGAHASQN